MTQRIYYIISGLLLASVINLQAAAPRLNVLFLSIDDLKPELGAYGATHIQSPHMDRLAANGVLMEKAYCQQAVCSPSRMSMFTGRRPDFTKVWDLKTDLRTVAPESVTLPEYFKQHGYLTAGAGKVMHGSKNEDPPSWSEPFVHDEELTYAEGWPVPADNKYQGKAIHEAAKQVASEDIKRWQQRKKRMRELNALPPVECIEAPDDAYADGAIANWAVKQLKKYAKEDKPFFLTLGFHKPHLPLVAPKRYWDLYDRADIQLPAFRERAAGSPEYAYSSWGELRNYSGIPGGYTSDITDAQKKELIHGYYACVSYIDAQVGKVLAALDRLGLADNTVVVLWGDHGWHLGDHGLWCKHTNFEQATRAPLIFRAPSIPAGKRIKEVVEFVDIFPTVCELAGLPVPDFTQGESLVRPMKNPDAKAKGYAISQYPRTHKNNMGYALRTERYRLVWWLGDHYRSTRPFKPELIMAVELYDYDRDPEETVNRADDPEYREARERLEQQLWDFFASQLRWHSK